MGEGTRGLMPSASLHPAELEWKLSESGAIKTDLEENPRKPIEDTLLSLVRCSVPTRRDSDSEVDESCS